MNLSRLPLWLWPVAGILVISGFNGVTWLPKFTSSNATYCLTCHGTGETPDMGKPSEVHPGYDKVTCTQCHANPGQMVITEGYRGGYSADPARVSAECIRCHKDVGTMSPDTFRFNVMDIKIPHRFHVETVQAKCTDCHRNIAHDLAEEATNRPRMEYCFQCHKTPQSQTCTKCHAKSISPPRTPGPPPSPSTAMDAQSLYQKYCSLCHGDKGDKLPTANLASKEFVESRGEAGLMQATAEGKGGMPAFGQGKGGNLSNEEISALIKFVRSWTP